MLKPTFFMTIIASLTCFLSLGCASWKRWGTPDLPPPSFADNDPTFKLPLRPQSSPNDEETDPKPKHKEKSWWDISSYLDERTQKIERDLGY